jgi:pimeloyl-ACP methyl ester carboxylesterase
MKLEVLHTPAKAAASLRPPVLFVHGSYCSARIWEPRFMPYFSENGYGCHALSLLGHGESEGMLSWAALADFVDDVAQVIETLDEAPVLIGHSMGGLVVQHLLARKKPRAAVLLATVPPSGLGSSAMHMSMQAPDVLWQLGLLQSLGPEAVSADVMARAMLSPGGAPDSGRKLLTYLQRESPRAAAELLSPSQPKPVRGDDKPPILVLGGDADLFLPVAALRETATFFDADLKILPSAPHGLMIDEKCWKPAADEILAFLKRSSA